MGQPPLDPKNDDVDFQTAATENFKNDSEAKQALANTTKLAAIDVNDYDAVLYPGGHGSLWDLAEDAGSIILIESVTAADKYVSAVCHAPAVFRHANNSDGSYIIAGKKVTCFTNNEEAAVGLTDVVPFLLEDELQAKGGIFSKGEDLHPYAVADGKFITSQNPASSELDAQFLAKALSAI